MVAQFPSVSVYRCLLIAANEAESIKILWWAFAGWVVASKRDLSWPVCDENL
jgi:hypothetical protein